MTWWGELSWIVGGFVFGSLCEYVGHRLMHFGRLLGKTHRNHHKSGQGQGVWLEFFDYMKAGVFFMIFPFLISTGAGIGFAIGATSFAFFAAFAHQLQHDNPGKCFWMPMPIHHVHHKYKMWHHNFGMALDWWDRIFGTYVYKENWRESLDPALASKSILDIQWIGKLRRAKTPTHSNVQSQ